MNFEYYKKVLLLPLKSTEKGVLRTLAYHCNPDQDNLCIPSWNTLVSESGVARGIINKILTISQDAGIISYRNRGDVGAGKKPNEYFFLFDDIQFYGRGSQIKLSKKNQQVFKLKIAKARADFKNNEEATGKNNSSFHPAISSVPNQSNSITTSTNQNSQKFTTELSSVAGLTGGAINTSSEPISASTDTLSIKKSVCKSKKLTSRDITIGPCNNKDQKTVLHEKSIIPNSNIEHDSQIKTVAKESPSSQSNDEWLADYE